MALKEGDLFRVTQSQSLISLMPLLITGKPLSCPLPRVNVDQYSVLGVDDWLLNLRRQPTITSTLNFNNNLPSFYVSWVSLNDKDWIIVSLKDGIVKAVPTSEQDYITGQLKLSTSMRLRMLSEWGPSSPHLTKNSSIWGGFWEM